MSIPTEPIGSIPRPPELIAGSADYAAGRIGSEELEALIDAATRDTVSRFEELGSPVITDGEQGKSSFATYPLEGLTNLEPDGAVIPFADGHTRQLPRLTAGPFRYGVHAEDYVVGALRYASKPVKQAVIAPSALSLIYPADGLVGYDRAAFLEDLVDEAEADIRGAFQAGAQSVQLDFTEGRLSLKIDPSKGLLSSFVALNNRLLDRFTPAERARIGLHTCPGGDQDSTHSLDVDYCELLPALFSIRAGAFYLQLASEPEPDRVLAAVAQHVRPHQRVFVGVIDPVDPEVETPEQVCARVLSAAKYLSPEQLGTCDDCGFSPFGDDVSTSREMAWAKIRARVEGTALAADRLGV